ncbi:AGAP008690-PA [Anopheles gambiae str. PEST]|uniref:AGAP008690-PA n=1 Tax=Anopheles gambiae TaxID=7165 RepID=Q7Q8D0_ANOGA|nr:AGAP008690-PA [Anopheles gambiae str. PEST]
MKTPGGKMRMKYGKLFIFFMICFNLIVFYYSWKYFLTSGHYLAESLTGGEGGLRGPAALPRRERVQHTNGYLRKSITFVFRDFYDFDNDLLQSIGSVTALIPGVSVFVIAPELPYPPLDIFNPGSNVRFFHLAYDVTKTLKDTFPVLHVSTRYVLFMPDSVRLTGRGLLSRMLREIDTPSGSELLLQQHQHAAEAERARWRIVAVPFGSNAKGAANCVQLQLDLPNWTLEYVTGNETERCDMFKQKHAILVETELLREMPDALASPFPDVFYIQAKLAGVKVLLLNGAFQDGRKLFTSYHTKTKRRNQRKEQFKALYRRLQVKKVIRKNYLSAGAGSAAANARRKYVKSYEHNNQTISLLTEITFYGCEKQTRSCIGQVHNGRPFYRYLGRNTPPCCLEKLKAVFRHVVDEFENVGIRYWLDNRALRDAIELKGLAPDAYEIDLSFNGDDVQRSVALRKAQTRPHTDEAGFHWLKATDGHYFRVQYSKQNTIAVNLLPFDLSSGELVRPSGFYGWKARKFSVEFLHPMSTVLFLGKPIMCPNNVIEYLEVKKVK